MAPNEKPDQQESTIFFLRSWLCLLAFPKGEIKAEKALAVKVGCFVQPQGHTHDCYIITMSNGQ